MIKRFAKSAIKELLAVKAFRPLLRLPALQRRLQSTTIYPDWVWALRQETETWLSSSPDWTAILKSDANRWKSARRAALGGPRVLIATSTGGVSLSTTIESMLAVALTLRGADVHFLLCDEHLPACFVPTIRQFPDTEDFATHGPTQHMCSTCFPVGRKVLGRLGLPLHRHSEYISREDFQESREISSHLPISQIADYRFDGVPVGEHALASALHFYARGSLNGEPQAEAILRRYLFASLLSMFEIRRLLKTHSFACILMHHGIYVPHGLFIEVARQHNVRVATWAPAYRKQTFIFSHQDAYHHTMLSEPTTYWESVPWTPEMEAEILEYLHSRRSGSRDWISYQQNTQQDVSAIAQELGVDFTKPCIGMLTNVLWDAQVHYPANAFANMVEWALETIRYFANRPDLHLIIRVHPAEVQHPLRSRQPIIDEINRAFPTLPKNVFIIPPDKLVNTYAVMSQCDTVIIYATKTGVELASTGIPVIVAGDAWARNKGFTLDASSREEYFRLLDRLPLKKRLTEAVAQRARKYAYHFFFRRMILLPFLMPPWPYTLDVSGLDDLVPGRSVGLDVICNGILNGDEFIYPFDLHPEAFDDRMTVSSKRSGVMTRVGSI